jgi:starch phosphorylase
MVLGIGGVRALRALGLTPAVWHMNEGHAAFLVARAPARAARARDRRGAALEAVAAQGVFTTHTPVAAGHDAFHHDLLAAALRRLHRELGLADRALLALGARPA